MSALIIQFPRTYAGDLHIGNHDNFGEPTMSQEQINVLLTELEDDSDQLIADMEEAIDRVKKKTELEKINVSG